MINDTHTDALLRAFITARDEHDEAVRAIQLDAMRAVARIINPSMERNDDHE